VPRLSCTLLYHSVSPHLQQLYTGFMLLHRAGLISLRQRPRRTPVRYDNDAQHLDDAGHAHLDVVIDGAVRVHFDTHDSLELATPELDECDVYFKRSFSRPLVDRLPDEQRTKVFPLGLNYRVLPDDFDLFAMRRELRIRKGLGGKLTACRRTLDVANFLGYEPRLSAMEGRPEPEAEPRVLFLVAAYDPYDGSCESADKIEDRVRVNETRAQCVRLLREAIGERFTGGFAPSPFTRKHYGDLTAPEGTTVQARYVDTLRSHPICVASTGLHGSTGWKLAEYVAFAKAPVSEKLLYEPTGDLAAGRNYLEFVTPEDCVAAALLLVEDADLRRRLMQNNARYYARYLRPDALVRNALDTALSFAPATALLT
jgi:hypothetical protein